MKKLASILFLIMNYSFVTAQADPNVLITVKTEPPVLVNKGGISYAMKESEYQTLAARLSNYPNFISIKRKPKKLSADAKFGFNLVISHKNISWILDGSETRGYILYADINGDGDLTNDSPLKLKKRMVNIRMYFIKL